MDEETNTFVFSQWIKNQKELLLLEKDAEVEQIRAGIEGSTSQQCQDKGISLLKMYIQETKTSLFGRCTYTISKYNKDPLPMHSFKVGDEVSLYSQKAQGVKGAETDKAAGIVTKVTAASVDVTCESDETELIEPLRMDMRANEANHRKLMQGLADLESVGEDSRLVSLLLHNYDSSEGRVKELLGAPRSLLAPRTSEPDSCGSSSTTGCSEMPQAAVAAPLNKSLNPSQREAIQHALTAPHLALIHGPVRNSLFTHFAHFYPLHFTLLQ